VIPHRVEFESDFRQSWRLYLRRVRPLARDSYAQTESKAVSHPLRLLIVDDHGPTRVGLRMRLARERDLSVVGEAGGPTDALHLAGRLRPDVVLVDLELGDTDTDGIELIGELRRVVPTSACVILSIEDSHHNRARASAAGISAFVGKQEGTDVLLRVIRQVAGDAKT
jgi:DNA-binding NarL/FixJ family response regulator